MNDSKKKVLDMVESGKISTVEADRLLKALEGPRKRGLRFLVDPFERIGLSTGLGIGLAVALASLAASIWLDFRYDGFLDIHSSASEVTWRVAAMDQLVAWPVSAMILWLVSFAFARRGRFVDFLAALGVARLPVLVGGLVLASLMPNAEVLERIAADPASVSGELRLLLPLGIAALLVVGWFIAMLVFAFGYASGLKGKRLALAFTVALIAAEAVSKALLFAIA